MGAGFTWNTQNRDLDIQTTLQTFEKAKELILTGRNATMKVIEKADLVTEMQNIKHPFEKGILAQKGIEW